MANFPTSAPNLKTNYVDNVDDVMAANQNTPNDEVNAIASKIGTGASTPTAGLFLQGTGTGTSAWNTLNAPQGFLLNGKIVPSVTSDNLTVALKTLAGTDPSASNPIHIRIGDTIRTITSALSVTKNAGTNWCNAGSTELATKEIDYFVYLGYNATDGVTLGFSRIPYGALYSDFSATTTNEKYCAISTITNATASDVYTNIGRFAATLSAGAGYTWSVPTFTASNLIQRPIYETRHLNGNITFNVTTYDNGSGGQPTTNSSVYKIIGDRLIITNSTSGYKAGTNNYFTITAYPFTPNEYASSALGIVFGPSYLVGTVNPAAVSWSANINDNVQSDFRLQASYRI